MQVPGQTAHSVEPLHAKHAILGCAHTAGAALLHSISSTLADHIAAWQGMVPERLVTFAGEILSRGAIVQQ